jgi:hypothetical protein
MDKHKALEVETSRPRTLSTLLTGPKKKLDQDKYTTASPTAPATVTSAPAPVQVSDSLEPLTADSVGSGQTLYERLVLASGQYCPTLDPAFYRRVWFDGLEAFEDLHFHVDLSTGCVVPNATLPSTSIVTASYVKS